MTTKHPLSSRFLRFADEECKGSSPLYEALSREIARDESILEIASESRAGQPVPNLLFAAVHFLLARDGGHPLGRFYASCDAHPANPAQAFPVFKDFVQSRRGEIESLARSRLVQTNEVRRSAYLFPALGFAAAHFEPGPLALLEIGTSAGLNLLWDRYRYSYGGRKGYGDAGSPVLITSTFRGPEPACLGLPVPEISHRIGIDLNIVDTSITDEANWLRALVWPEHDDRRALMDAALKLRSDSTPDLRQGDGFAMIEELVHGLPAGSLPCVYHTHVANQVPKESLRGFLESIDRIGADRDIIHVFNNINPSLHLTAYRNGVRIEMPLANIDGHGRWIEWLAHEND